jgi:hypothetical protein
MSILYILNTIFEGAVGLVCLSNPTIAFPYLTSPESKDIGRFFGLGITTIALITWFARHEANTPAGRRLSTVLTGFHLANVGLLLTITNPNYAVSLIHFLYAAGFFSHGFLQK